MIAPSFYYERVFGSMIESYDIHHYFSTPSLPLMIGIIIDVNDDNCGPSLIIILFKLYFNV